MGKDSRKYRQKKLQICRTEKARERLTGRTGLSLFIPYMHGINIFPILDSYFGSIHRGVSQVAK